MPSTSPLQSAAPAGGSRPLESADPYLPGIGDVRYGVDHYDLALTYKPAGNHLQVRATLDVTTLGPTSSIALDLHGLRVLSVAVGGASVARWTHRGGRLTVRFTDDVPQGSVLTVVVSAKGSPAPVRGPEGGAGWEELTDGVIVAAQPHGASSWFPCNNRAADKATYRFTVTTDAAYTVVANGVLTGSRKAGRATTWTYDQREPMSPYLATLQIGRYERRVQREADPAGDGPSVELVAPVRLRTAAGVAFADQPAMVDALAAWFGAYPFPGYTAVVTDDPLEIPLESQTISTFGANFCTRAWDSQRLIAHELAHQWFGNSVTAGQWRDIWLHEGFACYAEWLWSEASGGPSAAEQAARAHRRLAGLPQDLLLADPGRADMFDDRVYKRGALTLHALRMVLGDTDFRALLHEWSARYRYAAVATPDFEALAAEVAGEERAGAVAGVLHRWLRATRLPTLPTLPAL